MTTLRFRDSTKEKIRGESITVTSPLTQTGRPFWGPPGGSPCVRALNAPDGAGRPGSRADRPPQSYSQAPGGRARRAPAEPDVERTLGVLRYRLRTRLLRPRQRRHWRRLRHRRSSTFGATGRLPAVAVASSSRRPRPTEASRCNKDDPRLLDSAGRLILTRPDLILRRDRQFIDARHAGRPLQRRTFRLRRNEGLLRRRGRRHRLLFVGDRIDEQCRLRLRSGGSSRPRSRQLAQPRFPPPR